MLNDNAGAFNPGRLQIDEGAIDESLTVRGINKNQIESLMTAEALKVVGNVPGDDGRLFDDPDFGDISANQIYRPGIFINEDGMDCPAAQGFDSHGTGAGIKVENPFRPEPRSKDIENRFA